MTSEIRTRPARRTIVKGAAWAVPAVAVASAAPAYAASGDPIDPTFQPGSFCKHSNADEAHGVICFANTTDEDITLTLGDFDWDSAGIRQAYFSIGGQYSMSATIGANTTRCLWVDAKPFPSLGNDLAVIHFSYTYNGVEIDASVKTDTKEMSNCNSAPGQPGQSAPHPTPGPAEGDSSLYETEEVEPVEEPATDEKEAEVEPSEPVESTEPVENTEPTEPVESTEPVENTEPTEPVENTEPVEDSSETTDTPNN